MVQGGERGEILQGCWLERLVWALKLVQRAGLSPKKKPAISFPFLGR
jgi:hypothetical protein